MKTGHDGDDGEEVLVGQEKDKRTEQPLQPFSMKFGKWDTKYLKRNTKSTLSLSLTKRDCGNDLGIVVLGACTGQSTATASTISSTSSTVLPVETIMELV